MRIVSKEMAKWSILCSPSLVSRTSLDGRFVGMFFFVRLLGPVYVHVSSSAAFLSSCYLPLPIAVDIAVDIMNCMVAI